MNIKNIVKETLDKNKEIYLDTTVGWYKGNKDYRTGGQDIIYSIENNEYYKEYDFVITPNNIEKTKVRITLDEIVEELTKFNVKEEEITSGAIINRGDWEPRG
ncbi:hypothetical protein EV215_0395 [Hypnocyclicus thermotrophus]|uniref:Uncharacterized protein n=1 Tax=Hypnocyclicus thermotrophus TaxID=1627895 RepID=A0AA46E113_9FUSO|nr:hypothetical protein [Hypnocyclicus thermotrophus]TDT72585.1 hypothetical protein EV215_0395 [Hypnocyclicus thermotrophus]